jgi:L-fuconolactonase
VRHLVHRDHNPDLLADPRIDDVLAMLAERDLTFDVCAETEHLLRLVPALADRHPSLTLVIDHLAKPPIAAEGWEPWAHLLADAATARNTVVKLSGLNTAATPAEVWRRAGAGWRSLLRDPCGSRRLRVPVAHGRRSRRT